MKQFFCAMMGIEFVGDDIPKSVIPFRHKYINSRFVIYRDFNKFKLVQLEEVLCFYDDNLYLFDHYERKLGRAIGLFKFYDDNGDIEYRKEDCPSLRRFSELFDSDTYFFVLER